MAVAGRLTAGGHLADSYAAARVEVASEALACRFPGRQTCRGGDFMKIKVIVYRVIGCALIVGLAGCGGMETTSTAKTAMSLFDQMGGMDQITKLSNSFVSNVATDSRTSALMTGVDQKAATAKVSNELCALSGGGCKPTLTEAQIEAGAKKLNPTTTSALNESFSKSVSSLSSSPMAKESVTKLLGPKIGGIVGALM
jgi:hypothetical protein